MYGKLKTINSINENSESGTKKMQLYDMLSIRRQVKNDTKHLVQTNISVGLGTNNKSAIILKKLMDVAN